MTNTIVTQPTSATGAAAAAGLTSSGTQATAGQSAQNAFTSLTDNFQGFLQMLMTQLQNQDPTSPMNSSQFTTELVQFSGVEQQISTNTNLGQLIQLTQSNTMVQSGQLLGKQVQVTSDHLSLQSGSAAIAFTSPAAGPVAVAVYNSAGQHLYDASVNAAPGNNVWRWNGQTAGGVTEPDGAYRVAVAGTAADGTSTPLPFTVMGVATGVQAQGSTVQLRLGQLSVDMSALTSVGN